MSRALGALLESAFFRALASIDVEARVRVAAKRVPRLGPVRVVAIGKAAPAMARGALATLGDRVVEALVVTADGVAADGLGDATVLRAAHPLPDRRSVRAAERALAIARASGRERGVLVALVSGGASSLACAPYRTTLARKVAVVRALLHARATIEELNVVRRHASRIKGGALLRAARPATVVSILASDVIGGGVFDIGSGPSVPDPTTRAAAREVLARHHLPAIPLRDSAAPPASVDAQRSIARVVAGPNDLARAVRALLGDAGLRVRTLPSQALDVATFAAAYAELARDLAPGDAIVRAAEPTIAIGASRPGRGGRCAHLAALVAASLPRDVTFMAAASDGVDGASGTAGAVVDRARWSRLAPAEIADAVARFDTASLHLRADTAIRGGPTGANFTDVHVLARAR